MFYSHEVLTNSKYGVATVWLVATLGSNSARRKVNRSEILSVNVGKACETITSSEAPLALRLQSNLLYGLSSVYSQQCTFVLSDAEHVRTQVRNAMNAIRVSSTKASKTCTAKRDNITIVDEAQLALDPDGEYIPGLLDLSLDLVPGKPLNDSLFTIDTLLSRRSMSVDLDPVTEQLIIPSDDINIRTPSLGPASSFSGSNDPGSIRLGSQLFDAFEGGILEDVGLNVDEHGNIFDGPTQAPEDNDAPPESIFGQDALPESFVDNYILPGDDAHLDLLENARPFSPRAASAHRDSSLELSSAKSVSSIVVRAPNRARRGPRTIPLDSQMEIDSADIISMGRNYATSMQHAATARFHRGGMALAQRNAQFWVFGGMGSTEMLTLVLPPELQSFGRAEMLAAFPAQPGSGAVSTKRGSDEEDAERRVRARVEESEIGRGDMDLAADDLMLHDDPTVELGREPGTPLAEHLSSTMMQMPWNIRSSTRGSSAPRPFGGGSLGRAGSSSVGGGGFSMGIRGSSVAASPLAGLPRAHDMDIDVGQDFENEPHQADQQIVLEHQSVTDAPSWISQSQDPDSGNFFDFILNAMEEKRLHTGSDSATVTFEEILAPDQHDRTVAAHGLMHVLSLGGRDMLQIRQSQDLPFLPIEIGAR